MVALGTVWSMISKGVDYWGERCADVLVAYDLDPEAAHSAEDELLHAFVMAVAEDAVPDVKASAEAIYGGLLLAPRVRWYA